MTSDSPVEPASPVEPGVPVEPSIAPWLAVGDGARAVAFYQNVFDAEEVYRLDGVDDQVVVARLRVGSAEFWLQEDYEGSPTVRGAGAIRMIMTVEIGRAHV